MIKIEIKTTEHWLAKNFHIYIVYLLRVPKFTTDLLNLSFDGGGGGGGDSIQAFLKIAFAKNPPQEPLDTPVNS